MEIKDFEIAPEYLVKTIGTSDGIQDKYFYDNKWFKLDRYGKEGFAETAASCILKENGLDKEQFVEYFPCKINGQNGCYSENFLKENESFITFYRFYKNITGRDLAAVCSKMDYDDAIEYVINFIFQYTKVDIHEYLANTFLLDKIILNEDRHFNNLGLIYNETSFRPAPIFDNGKSFLIGNKKAGEQKTINDKIKFAFSKGFSPDFKINSKYLEKYQSFSVSRASIEKLKDIDEVFYQITLLTIN